jgi:Tfp pilus assembly protein PilX
MQRVRIGLTGLAAVFVVVMLAAVFTNASDEERITANSIEQQLSDGGAPANVVAAEPKEPLAELGMVPGAAEEPAKDSSTAATGQ